MAATTLVLTKKQNVLKSDVNIGNQILTHWFQWENYNDVTAKTVARWSQTDMGYDVSMGNGCQIDMFRCKAFSTVLACN